jgi:hypothetical protein
VGSCPFHDVEHEPHMVAIEDNEVGLIEDLMGVNNVADVVWHFPHRSPWSGLTRGVPQPIIWPMKVGELDN